MKDFLTSKRGKWVLFGFLGFVIVILGISLYFIIQDSLNSATLNIMVAPTTAKVVVDGKTYGTVSEVRIHPGEYTAEISADGFEPKTINFVAEENAVTRLWVYLDSLSGDEEWLSENGNGLIVGAIKNTENNTKSAELIEQSEILQVLPIEIDYYTDDFSKRIWYNIAYDINEDYTDFTLMVTDYTGGNYEDALNKLRARGFEPNDYEIQYVDASAEYEYGRAE